MPAAVDVALTLALLAAFASVAFVQSETGAADDDPPRSMAGMSLAMRSLHRRRGRRRRRFLPGRHGRAAALPRRAHAPARADQGRQSRSRPGRAGPAAAGGRPAGGAQADRRLAAGRCSAGATVAQLIARTCALRRADGRMSIALGPRRRPVAVPGPGGRPAGRSSRATPSPRSSASSSMGCCWRWSGSACARSMWR